MQRHGIGTVAFVVAFVVWAVTWAVGAELVAAAMDVECRDSPCAISAPERVHYVTWALALVPAVLSGALVVALWKRRR